MSRFRLIAGLMAAGALIAPAAAQAHVTVSPPASRPADLQIYTVRVPNERDVATTGLRLQVPAGIDFVLIEDQPGWRGRIIRKGDAVSELRWTGGSVAPDEFAELRFIARNPAEEGELAWPAIQEYADGESIRWIGAADSEEPAPRTELSESAEPVDLASTHGEGSGQQQADSEDEAAAAAAGDGEDDGGSDTLTLAIAIAAALLAAAALALALRRRPPGEGQREAW